MLDVDKAIEATTRMVGDDRFDSDIEELYVPMAIDAVLSYMFPFEDDRDVDDIPERCWRNVSEIAVYLLNRRGAEGETRHVENGTTHEWSSAGVPAAYFVGIVPNGAVL